MYSYFGVHTRSGGGGNRNQQPPVFSKPSSSVSKPVKKEKSRVFKELRSQDRKEINAPTALLYPYLLNGTTNLNPEMGSLLNRYGNKYQDSYFKDIPITQDPYPNNPANGLVWYFFDNVNGVPWSPLLGVQPTINSQNVNINNNPRSEPNFNIMGDIRDPANNPYHYVCIVPNKELRANIDQGNADSYGIINANVVAVKSDVGREMVRWKQASAGHIRCYYIQRFERSSGEFVQYYGIFKPYQMTPQSSPYHSPQRLPPPPPQDNYEGDINDVLNWNRSPPASPPRLTNGSPSSSTSSYTRDIRDILGPQPNNDLRIVFFGRRKVKTRKSTSFKSLTNDLKKLMKC